ncbi:MAG: PEP-CTERM sorting domain-containing protein [Armatimonadota bacterium]|nr:PEP-CTERM sorting domain-containing protein [bacterium]
MRAIIIATSMIIILCCCTAAWCQDPDTPSYSARVIGTRLDVAGSCVWQYTLLNSSIDPSYTVWLLGISVNEEASAISAPEFEGWVSDVETDPHFITWMYGTGELAAGESENRFIVEFDTEPVTQSWTVLFNYTTPEGNVEMASEVGDVQVQVTETPEPGSIAALALGLMTMGVGFIRKRR